MNHAFQSLPLSARAINGRSFSSACVMRGKRFFANAMWIVLALGLVLFLPGCEKVFVRGKAKDQPGDLILSLGRGVKMRFVPVEALDIYVGRYEVRNREYRCFKLKHSSGKHKKLTLDKNEQPVVNVSWNDAQQFCAWLNTRFGVKDNKRYLFRLPTEEEWETFATCGQSRDFPWGNEWPPPVNWNYYGAENPGIGQKLRTSDKFRVSCPVQKSGTNEWRLFGVGGNVWEWCEDAGDVEAKTRTLRGASWVDCHPLFLQVYRNKKYPATYHAINMGFRVVAEVRDATDEEKRQYAELKKQKQARIQAEKARVRAEKVREEAEAARQAAQIKEQQERAGREKQASDQVRIQELVEKKHFDLASEKLRQYEKGFGKDAFYNKWSATVKNTRVMKLAEDVLLEFVRVKPLKSWIGKYEVTNKQFKQFKSDHDSGAIRDYTLNEDDQPVVKVSWDDAKAFCQWLNTRFADRLEAGQEFRLPFETEWEVMATCGESRDFPWGSQWPPLYGNFGSIEDYDDGFSVSCPVMESGKNEWDIYGVSGNVWEWCEGWYDSGKTYRVIRGGAWNLTRPDDLKVANRSGDVQTQKNHYIGFRVIIGPKEPAMK